MEIQTGQCGLCAHFGEHHAQHENLVQIRERREVPPNYKEECGHPHNSDLGLLVTATSSCDGFQPASLSGPAT